MEYSEELMQAIDEALQDKDFVLKLAEAKDTDQFKAFFQERGIEIDDTIAQGAFDKLAQIEANGGELSEDDLTQVAGGCKKCYFGYTAGGAAVGLLVGGPLGAVVGGCIGSYIGIARGIAHDTGKSKKKK